MRKISNDVHNDKAEKDRQYVTALARGLQILRCFSHEKPALTPQEIVRMTGLPQPTVWRLCYTLTKEGFITCAGEGQQMVLGLPAVALGYAALVHQTLPKAAQPYMQALTDKYRTGMSLAVRDELRMLYIQRTHGDFIHLNDPVGARRPFALAPTGWACFAGYDAAEREAILEDLEHENLANFKDLREQLEQAAAQYQQKGFVTSLSVMHEHLNAIAVPIRSPKSGTLYGLSVSGLRADWPEKRLEQIAPELISIAQRLAVAAD